MKTQADKTALNKSKAVANTSSDKQDKRESEAQFKDNRTEVVAQRKFRAMAENSLQAGKIAQLHAIANRSSPEPVQKQGVEEEEELLQGKFETLQTQGLAEGKIQSKSTAVQNKEERPSNNTGLPDTLKSGIENLSGLSLDDVKVHYNSPKPAQLQAHAFARGTDIHMSPGQEKHLPHEAWHVVQQKQGRVQPTKQLKGKVSVNNDAGLEKEAELMGVRGATAAADDAVAKKRSASEIQLQRISNEGTSESTQRVDGQGVIRKQVGRSHGTAIQLAGKKGQVSKKNEPVVTDKGEGEESKGDEEKKNYILAMIGNKSLELNEGNPDHAKMFKQEVKFKTDTLLGDTVGVEMTANPLGPNHPQGFQPTQGALKKIMEVLPTEKSNKGKDKYIKGHLLNDNLGGPGQAENLYPITAQANAEHRNEVEDKVVEWVNEKGFWVHYHVKVNRTKLVEGKKLSRVDADLVCTAHTLDEKGKKTKGFSKTIHSIYKDEQKKSPEEVREGEKGAGTAKKDPDFDPQLVAESRDKGDPANPAELGPSIRVAANKLIKQMEKSGIKNQSKKEAVIAELLLGSTPYQRRILMDAGFEIGSTLR